MNKALKMLAMVAAAMTAVGLLLAGISFALGAPLSYYWDGGLRTEPRGGWDEHAMRTEREVLPAFSGMDLNIGAYELQLERTDGAFEVAYQNTPGDQAPVVRVDGGMLYVDTRQKHRVNFALFGVSNHRTRTLTVRLPQSVKLGSVKIDGSAGDLSLDNLTADDLEINLGAGQIELDRIQVKRLLISASAGDVRLTDCTADAAQLELSLGKLKAEGLRTAGLKVEASSGELDLAGTFSGSTEIEASLGDVNIKNAISRESCALKAEVSLGSLIVDSAAYGREYTDMDSRPNRMDVSLSCGSARIDFG